MTRAGREPTEDVRRRVRAACKEAGLTATSANFFLADNRRYRIVMARASLPEWPHEAPTVEIFVVVKTNGDVSRASIRCRASDGDPLMTMWTTPLITDCTVPLEDLADALVKVLEERRTVIELMAAGEDPPFVLRWTWGVPSLSL